MTLCACACVRTASRGGGTHLPSAWDNRTKGSREGFSASARCGALTTPTKERLANASTICAAISRATFFCASSVDAPRCGVQMTRGCAMRALDVAPGGSCSKTSMPAANTFPLVSACSRSASFTMPPRAALMMTTPFLHLSREARQMRLRVASL